MKLHLPDGVGLGLEPAVVAQQLGAVVELEVGLHIVEALLQQVAELVEAYCNMPMNLDPFSNCFQSHPSIHI